MSVTHQRPGPTSSRRQVYGVESADESTNIGEKGVTLSGGQRQRICVARAAYHSSEIVLLDDPLSALDANVGRELLNHCILDGPLSGRTRILVTHHLDVLPKADWIVVMDSSGDSNEGRIAQQGTYSVCLLSSCNLQGIR